MWSLGSLAKELCLLPFVCVCVCARTCVWFVCCCFPPKVNVRKGDVLYAEGVGGEGLQLGKS